LGRFAEVPDEMQEKKNGILEKICGITERRISQG
jgi:hypothetical protein